MRTSSNGCRVLRKGCSEGRSTIRPCLQWIKSPEAQANTTVFIAKFYGRVGLIDLCPLYSDRFCTGLWADVEPDLWLIHDAVQTAN